MCIPTNGTDGWRLQGADREQCGLVAQQPCGTDTVGAEVVGEGGVAGREDGCGEAGLREVRQETSRLQCTD